MFAAFLRDECGATALEYALIAGLVSIAIVATIDHIGVSSRALFGTISTRVAEAAQ